MDEEEVDKRRIPFLWPGRRLYGKPRPLVPSFIDRHSIECRFFDSPPSFRGLIASEVTSIGRNFLSSLLETARSGTG